MTKNSACRALYFRNHTSCNLHLWCTCVKKNISRHFFKFFIKGVKREKIAQNEKKICLSPSVSQEPYIIYLWFLVDMRKMMISPRFFFIFSKFWFSWFLREKKDKKWPKITNFSPPLPISQELLIISSSWYTCVKYDISRCFSLFF